MDPKQTAEILKTCESIGFADGDKYIAEPDWEGNETKTYRVKIL